MSTDPGGGRFVRAVEEQGISLLEVLISIVLILLTVPFLAAMEVSALKMNGDAGEIDLAMWAANAKVEEMRAAGYDEADKGDDEYTFPDGRVVLREWDVDKGKPVKDTRTITITAVEKDRVDARTVEIVFVLGKR